MASILLLSSLSGVLGHTAIAPALGVKGNPVRNDAQRPSTAKPCGNINIAQTLDTSTAVPAAADGSFTVTVTNFNAGQDGSTQVTGSVDATAVGKTFSPITISKNGVKAPTSVGSVQVDAALPAGTKCTGGKSKNLCLVSFVTAGNFGNCVVVSQGAAAAAAGNSTAAASTGAASTGVAAGAAAGNAAAATGAAAKAGTAAKAGKKGKGKKGKKAAGSAAAKAGAAAKAAKAEAAAAAAKP